jgi:methionine-rich copper-binding protein CopC
MRYIAKVVPLQCWALLGILLLALPSGAGAHAFLYYSVPKADSIVTSPPAEIIICFTEHLDARGSAIQVRNEKDDQVDKEDSHCDSKDPSLLKVSLPNLPPGRYKVSWKALSVDGHRTQGHFNFTIK